MDGYRAALEDMQQALGNVPCRCELYESAGECVIYWRDVDAIVQGALRGCPGQPP